VIPRVAALTRAARSYRPACPCPAAGAQARGLIPLRRRAGPGETQKTQEEMQSAMAKCGLPMLTHRDE